MSPERPDANDLLIARNGFLNIPDYRAGRREVGPLSARLFYTDCAQYAIDLNAPEPAHWLRFLASLETSPEWVACLRQIMGYCLWPRYDLQKFFVFHGAPRAGKGTIVRVMENLLGPAAVIGLRLDAFGSRFGLEPALGKRLAFVAETTVTERYAREAAANLKAVTGGDMIQVDRKNRIGFSGRLPLKIIMSSNELPILPDHSGALQQRMIPLRFVKSFFGAEDVELEKRLSAETPAILLWALEGLRVLYEAGRFILPDTSLEDLQQIVSESAPLQGFVDECCQVGDVACSSRGLHRVYGEWMRERGAQPILNEMQFATALRTTLPRLVKDRATRGATHCKGRLLVASLDAGPPQFPVWLGIAPRQEVSNG